MSKEDFLAAAALVYGEGPSGQNINLSDPTITLASFRAYTVYATAVLLLNRTDPAFPVSRAEGYFATATRLLAQNPAVICTGDLHHLCNLLLVAQYSCFASNLSGAWHFLGLASRLTIELSLHDERPVAAKLNQGQLNQRRWLFWALYTMERNLCVIVGRPFSIPDEVIYTPLPDLPEDDGSRALALHLIKHRRLESEIHVTLNQRPPQNGTAVDLFSWRDGMRRRLIEWLDCAPTPTTPSTQLAPSGIFESILHNHMVLLYYPSESFPNPSENETLILAQSAAECVSNYRRTFRDRQLRFFWRTTHNLFRSGVAMAYCVHLQATHHYLDLNQADMIESVNTCMSILWAMVERYPSGSVYRDAFESLVNSVLRSADGGGNLGQTQRQEPSAVAYDPSMFADMALPQESIDALYWGFGNLA
ncbi:transcription factor [Colletotrichum tofieldiae]|nr:transcription factor [Colletotrichum tofieldiae]GKT84249.1 transcription factor [Colletotrichum tofieldiae]